MIYIDCSGGQASGIRLMIPTDTATVVSRDRRRIATINGQFPKSGQNWLAIWDEFRNWLVSAA